MLEAMALLPLPKPKLNSHSLTASFPGKGISPETVTQTSSIISLNLEIVDLKKICCSPQVEYLQDQNSLYFHQYQQLTQKTSTHFHHSYKLTDCRYQTETSHRVHFLFQHRQLLVPTAVQNTLKKQLHFHFGELQ